MALQQHLRKQASYGLSSSSRARHGPCAAVSRAKPARMRRPAPIQQLTSPVVVEDFQLEPAAFEKPSPVNDYSVGFKFLPMSAPIDLKQSQVGALIGVVALASTVFSEVVVPAGIGGLLAAATAGALALWSTPRKPSNGITYKVTKSPMRKPDITTSPAQATSSTHDDLSTPLPSSTLVAANAPSTKALMTFEPAAPAADLPAELPAAAKPAAAAAASSSPSTAAAPAAAAAAAATVPALPPEETAHVAKQLSKKALPIPAPAFAGASFRLLGPGLVDFSDSKRVKVIDGAGTSSSISPERMAACKQQMQAYLDRASSLTLDLPRLDIPVGSSLDGIFSTKWEALLVHTVTPEGWAGDSAATWGKMTVLAAYGVPMAVAEVEQGGAAVVSVAAAVVSAAAAAAVVSKAVASAASAAASVGVQVPVVPRSGAVVAAVSAARALSVKQAGMRKLMGAVKLVMPLVVVAAVAVSSFADRIII